MKIEIFIMILAFYIYLTNIKDTLYFHEFDKKKNHIPLRIVSQREKYHLF